MPTEIALTARLPKPGEVVRLLADLAAADFPQVPCEIQLRTEVHQDVQVVAEKGSELPAHSNVLLTIDQLAANDFLTCLRCRLSVSSAPSATVTVAADEGGLYASVKVSIADGSPKEQLALRLLRALNARFQIAPPAVLASASLPEAIRAPFVAQERLALGLTDQLDRLGQQLAVFTAESAKAVAKRLGEIEEERKAGRAEFDATVAQRDEAHVAREQALAEREQRVDDREHKYARRGLQKEIIEALSRQIEEKVGSVQVKKARWPVHLVCCVVMMATGFGGGALGYSALKSNPVHWELLPMAGACTAIFAATLFFYLRWLSTWAAEIAAADDRKKRLAVDLLRGSWVVEFALEWEEEKDGAVPEVLLTSATRNLFQDSRAANSSDHAPLDPLLRALRGVKSLDVGLNGIRVEGKDLKG